MPRPHPVRRPTVTGLVLSCALFTACGGFNLSMVVGDGIPHDGSFSTTSHENGHVHRMMAWGRDGDGYRIEMDGTELPQLTADDADFVLTGGGEVVLAEYVSDEEWRRLELRHGPAGEERLFFVEGAPAPYDAEAVAWLAATVPVMIDHLGVGASSRVPRLMAEGGLDAVLADVERRETDGARERYYEAALAQPGLESADLDRVLRHAAEHVASDAHLADLLEEAVEDHPRDPLILAAVLDAAPLVESDAHLADVLETCLEDGAVRGETLSRVLSVAAREIQSDAHLADLLEDVVRDGDLRGAGGGAFVQAMAQVQSDAHAADVLEDLLERDGLEDAVLADILRRAGPRIESDAHLADVLEELPAHRLTEAGVRGAWLKCLATVDSDAHAADLLEDQLAAAEAPDVVADLVSATVREVRSDAHASDVLLELRRSALQDPRVVAALREAHARMGSSYRRELEERFGAETFE